MGYMAVCQPGDCSENLVGYREGRGKERKGERRRGEERRGEERRTFKLQGVYVAEPKGRLV